MEESRIIGNSLNNGDLTIHQSSNSYSSCTSSSLFSTPYSSILRSQAPNRSYPSIYNRPLTYLRPNLGGIQPEAGSAVAGNRLGILPPLSPYSPRSASSPVAAASPFHHARSLSQPVCFHLDSFPPTSSPLMPDVTLGFPAMVRTPTTQSAVPRRGFQIDIPVAFAGSGSGCCFSPAWAATLQRALQHDSPASGEVAAADRNAAVVEATGHPKTDGDDDGDDLVSTFLNLDSYESLDCCLTEKKEDIDCSRISGSRTNNSGGGDSSENEAESSSNGGGEIKHGNKRFAAAASGSRNFRSLSVDTAVPSFHLREESLRFPPSPSIQIGTLSARSGSSDISSLNMFGFESGKFEFNSTELKKIMANEKLAEMALTDPKRVKRILANRQSAARSKERKLRYITELEHKVKNLEAEATTLSAQLNIMQRDSAGLTSQNNELRYRIQAMEQQAQLRDALNQTLAAEVQRLKLATGGIGELQLSNGGANQQVKMTAQMLQLHHQFCNSNQPQQHNPANVASQQHSQAQQQQHELQQNDTACLQDANN